MVSATDSSRLDVAVLHLGRLVVGLERTPMREVQHTIGAGVFDEQGDGADLRSWLCYTVPGSQRVWLMSNQAGGEFVTSFALVSDRNAEPSAHCPNLPAEFTPIVLEPDLRLGSNSEQIARLFGAASPTGDWSLYRHVNSSNHDSLHFDITSVLSVRYEGGRVASLAASRATTN